MTVPIENVFYKTTDASGDPVILKLSLPQIDARDAVSRFPHHYAKTVDGFTAPPVAAPANPGDGAVGPGGGNPQLLGGIGVIEVIRPAATAKHGKTSAAAA